MLIALCLILAVAVVALGALLIRARTRLEEFARRDEAQKKELATARSELRDAAALADEADRERNEALERVQRSRRDAAEVANRLSAATARTEQLEADIRDLTAARTELAARASELETALAETEQRASARAPEIPTTGSPAFDGDVLWGLTLARLDRRWRVSVAAGVDAVSPLMTGDSMLAEAIRIETDAAREEAGAIIELAYDGDADVDGAAAATTVALVEELTAGVTRLADEADLTITVDDDAVLVALAATSDGKPVQIPGPADLLDAEGRYRIERQNAPVS